MNEKVKYLAVVGANLANVFIASPAVAQESQTVVTKESRLEQANTSSTATVESAWLKIPQMCKDRSFSSNPVDFKVSHPSAEVLNIHQELGALKATV